MKDALLVTIAVAAIFASGCTKKSNPPPAPSTTEAPAPSTTEAPPVPSTTVDPRVPVVGIWCVAKPNVFDSNGHFISGDNVPGDFSPCTPENLLPKIGSLCSKLGEWKTGCKPVICKVSCL